jgi:hypothetical protein
LEVINRDYTDVVASFRRHLMEIAKSALRRSGVASGRLTAPKSGLILLVVFAQRAAMTATGTSPALMSAFREKIIAAE